MQVNILHIIVIIVILVIVFLLLREFNCWYWKINERIRKQDDIINLLQKLLFESKTIESFNNGAFEEKYMNSDLLNEEEKTAIENLIEAGLKKGDKIILNKTSRKIKRVGKDEWILGYSQDAYWVVVVES